MRLCIYAYLLRALHSRIRSVHVGLERAISSWARSRACDLPPSWREESSPSWREDSLPPAAKFSSHPREDIFLPGARRRFPPSWRAKLAERFTYLARSPLLQQGKLHGSQSVPTHFLYHGGLGFLGFGDGPVWELCAVYGYMDEDRL